MADEAAVKHVAELDDSGAVAPMPERVALADGSELRYDASVRGLHVSQVCVVRVEGRPLAIPLPPAMARAAGFDLVPVDEVVLARVGVRIGPEQPAMPVPAPVAAPVAALVPEQLRPAVPPVATAPADLARPVSEKVARPGPDLAPAPQHVDGGPTLGPTAVSGPVDEHFALEQHAEQFEPARPYSVGGSLRQDTAPRSVPSWPDVERRLNDRASTSAADRVDLTVPDVATAVAAASPFATAAPAVVAGAPAVVAGAPAVVAGVPAVVAGAPAVLAGVPSGGEQPEAPAAPQPGALLVVRGLRRHGADVTVEAPDFDLRAGEILVVSGPERSGKTLLARALAGIDRVDPGMVSVAGQDLSLLPDAERLLLARVGIGLASALPVFMDDRSVLDNVALALLATGSDVGEARRLAFDGLASAGLDALGERRCDQLARSEAIEIALVRALVARPPLVVVDDITPGLGDARVVGMLDRIEWAARDGAVVVVTTTDPRVWHTLVTEGSARSGLIAEATLRLR